MEIIKTEDLSAIRRAAEVIKLGGVVVYPTDTAYGLGVDALNEPALEKLYVLKNMPHNKPMHVMVADVAMAKRYVVFTKIADTLADVFLPGPLTLVLSARDRVSKMIQGEGGSLGIRIPKYEVAPELARQANTAITTTSANMHGTGETPFSVDDVIRSFGTKAEPIDLALDGGTLQETPPSTFVDCRGSKPVILREGPIGREEILKVLG